jgi:hypothetical protein
MQATRFSKAKSKVGTANAERTFADILRMSANVFLAYIPYVLEGTVTDWN